MADLGVTFSFKSRTNLAPIPKFILFLLRKVFFATNFDFYKYLFPMASLEMLIL